HSKSLVGPGVEETLQLMKPRKTPEDFEFFQISTPAVADGFAYSRARIPIPAPPGRRPLPPHGTHDAVFPEGREAVSRRSPQQAKRPFYFHPVLDLLPRHQPGGAVDLVGADAVVHDGTARVTRFGFEIDPEPHAAAFEPCGLPDPPGRHFLRP